MGLFRRRAGRAEPLPAPVGGSVRLGALIDEALARRTWSGRLDPFELPIVVACRDLIAGTIGQLPLVCYSSGLPLTAQPPICVRPDPSETRFDTMSRLAYQLTGPGYVWVIPEAFYADGLPAAVRVVDAGSAAGTWDPSGRLVDVHHEGQRFDPAAGEAHLIRWRYDRVGAPGDCGPLAGCRRAVEHLAALWQMAGSFWEAGFPSLALIVDQALTSTQRRETKQAMLDAYARSHEPTVIDRGGRLEAVGASPVESQLVESIAAANVEIARTFGVTPSMVNVAAGDSLTYATTETELGRWLKLGLGQYLTRIESCWSDMRPYGQVCRFDTGELLRTDLAARYAAYSTGLGRWLTVQEVRAAESLPWPPPAPLAATDTLTADPVPSLTGSSPP